ncbi:macrolide ABC transporter ATP-binding protein [Streptosporangium jomthongense]|uniref:ABC transporter ATP-binding protein n=1 Tax=Marinobacter aromaticivorans TaxID=1494078 RepID=A0ABW2ISC4_9GAMM|nr:ABC transporter ATP-binding protein [Marinobacter aromaticivorans]GGE59673.1 macrolide ABC transporter ATP-binding protein [Streptosporangium jomthongense]
MSSSARLRNDDPETPDLPPAIIRMRNIFKIYGSGSAEVRALDGVDLTIRDGEFVAIMGPSGSGKSTCMNMIGCLDVPSAGEYLFRGVNVGGLDRDELALLRRHFMGFIFQSFNLLPRVNALANVELPLIYDGVRRSERRARAQEALRIVGLAGRESATPSQLSGGQQQRVAIARALVTEPPILLADEPTGNLDTAMADGIMSQLVQIRAERGITIIMVTHEPDIARYAERVLYFVDGKLVKDGIPAEVLS